MAITIVILIVLSVIIYKIQKPLRQAVFAKFYSYLFIEYYDNLVSAVKWQLFSGLQVAAKLKTNGDKFELLELGSGPGINFKYFPRGTQVTCIDPSKFFEEHAAKAAKENPHVNICKFILGKGESMEDIPDGRFDAVVTTLVMCCVDDVAQCLKEIKRVLKPGGKYYFLEHVQAKQSTPGFYVQKCIKYLWAFVLDSCWVDRPTWQYIEGAGFSQLKLEHFKPELKLLYYPLIWPHIVGIATK